MTGEREPRSLSGGRLVQAAKPRERAAPLAGRQRALIFDPRKPTILPWRSNPKGGSAWRTRWNLDSGGKTRETLFHFRRDVSANSMRAPATRLAELEIPA